MDLEIAKKYIEEVLNKKITNTMLADALGMQLSGVSRKIKTKTPVKPSQLELLEKYFNVQLTKKNNSDFSIYPTSLGVIPSELIEDLEEKTGIKLSLSQLAEIAGVSRQMIDKYKDKYLPLNVSEKIIKYFDKYNQNIDKNIEILKKIIVRVEKHLTDNNMTATPETKADAVGHIFKLYMERHFSEDVIDNINMFRILSFKAK